MRIISLLIISFFLVFPNFSSAQFFVSPNLGFKSSGLKGMIKLSQSGSVQTGSIADAGKTGFLFGSGIGYTLVNPKTNLGWYGLDLNLDISYTSIAYFEQGYNSGIGSGAYSANGLSGGSTSVISFDLMPIHRFNIPSFELLSPFAGIGLGFNYMSTGDVKVEPPSTNGTLTGNSEFKVGLIIYYGALLHVSDLLQPFIQFKHMIPFGSETVFTNDYQQASGGGSQKWSYSIADVPGYFNISAGCRFSF